MLPRPSGVALVVLGLAGVLACSFEPHGATGDATAPDASDAVGPDGLDACVPDPAGERCNGTDDDCDLSVDEDFPTLGDPCDGADADECLDDALACDGPGTGVACANPTPDDDVERCNGADDDCDLDVDETFTTLGMMCDGPDGDLCQEGALACSGDGTGVTCNDATGTTAETCNGTDDDCDLDVDEDFPTLGMLCDGADGDACLEGMIQCNGPSAVQCGDVTGTILETCNMADDDCDASIDETFDLASDPANCGQCGRACTNNFGPTSCSASTCMPSCTTAGTHDCDGNPVNGCEARNTNPACGSPIDLGDVRGDQGADVLTAGGYAEAFYRVTVLDSVSGATPLLARIALTSPPGTNFDLSVTCHSCGDETLSSSTGGVDIVNIGRNDFSGIGSYDILIAVRWTSSTACGNWSLAVTGNVATANRSCD